MESHRKRLLKFSVATLSAIFLGIVSTPFFHSLPPTDHVVLDSKNLVYVANLNNGEGRIVPIYEFPVWVERRSDTEFLVIDLLPKDIGRHCMAEPINPLDAELIPNETKFRNVCSSFNYDSNGEALPIGNFQPLNLRVLHWQFINEEYIRIDYAT